MADYKNPSIHVKKSRIWSVKQFFHYLKLNGIVRENIASDLPYPKIENRSVCLSFFNSGFFCQLCRSEPVVFSWDSKVSKLLKMVFPTISDILFRLRPTMSAIFSWTHPRRWSRRMLVFRPTRCRALISEIQLLSAELLLIFQQYLQFL